MSRLTTRSRLIYLAIIALLLLKLRPGGTAVIHANTFTVTNTADSGPDSLRQAITNANATPGLDTITFAIGTPGSQQTIVLITALPAITDPIFLDGWSQGGSGYAGPPLVEINGSGISTWNTSDGLNITAGDSAVRGLAINYFNISINLTTSGNNVLTGNYLGLALDGDTPIGNRTGIRIAATSDGNRIGTDGDGVNDLAERNIISAAGFVQVNNSFGILIEQGSDNHWIAGNFIGTDATGTQDRGNVSNGITTGGSVIIGTNGDGVGDDVEGNLIAGNNGHGVSLSTASNGTRVAGNIIGTDVSGTIALPNNANGVSVGSCSAGQCSDYIIGTNGDGVSDALEGNLISGNGADGVFIPAGALDNNVIAGNKIGTDLTGTAAVPNGDTGVYLGGDFSRLGTNSDGLSDDLEGNLISGNGDGGGNDNYGVLIPGGADHHLVAGNKIGTNAAGSAALPNGQTGLRVEDDHNTLSGNLISGNGEHGLSLYDAFFNTVTGNLIGTALDGVTPLGNSLHGIYISVNADDNTIGIENVIAFNGGDGVFVDSNCGAAFCIRNQITGNAIFENSGLGIDLYPNGVNVNDPLDPDTGANTRQNYPSLTAAASAGANLIITGTLNSTANLTFTLDFYTSSACDTTGFGEGALYLGAGQATTDANGDAAFSLAVAGLAQDGDAVTATATDPDGNTSEFSSCILIAGEEPITGLQAFDDSPTFLGLITHVSATLTSGTGVSYAWDFGDGATGSGASASHTYPTTGNYTATVTASNSLGSMQAATSITILPSPVCAATPDNGVTVFGSLDASAIQQAVDTPQAAGGMVKIAGVCAGVSPRNGMTQTVYIEETMTLAGGYTAGNWTTPNPESPAVLDALGLGRVIFALGAPLTLENLTLVNGIAPQNGTNCPSGCGGGLYTEGNLTLSHVTFQENQAIITGGAWVLGTLNAVDSDWLNNSCTNASGGALAVAGDAVVIGGLLQGNACGYGGGIFADAGLVISGTQFISNSATSPSFGSGGAIYAAGPLDITNALFEGNHAYTGGGAVLHAPGSNELLAILNTQFINNQTLNNAAQGGALYTTATASTIQSSAFLGNSAPGSAGAGGAIVAFKAITLTETTLISNTVGGQGGAIFHWGLSEPGNINQISPINMIDSLLTGNQAGGEGGGLYFRLGWEAANVPIQFINTTFEHNTSWLQGGGVYLGQPAQIENSTFRGNSSLGSSGGGIFAFSNLILAKSLLIGNFAYANGGGLALQGSNNAPSQITNAVFSGNTTFLTGASLYVNNPGSLDILYTTLAGTDSPVQGIAVSGANVEITNAILVSHTVGIVASGDALVTADHTLFHGNQTDVQGVTNLDPVYGNPQFLDAANGDFHLTLGSPAIDVGAATSVLSDFEDDLRPIIAQSDLGADEFGDSTMGDPGSTTTIGTGQIIITIPPGALAGPGNILFLPTFPPTLLLPPPWLPVSPGFQLLVTPVGHALEGIDPTFLLPITVTLTYTDPALAGIDESTLFLAVLDKTTGEWVDAIMTCPQPGTLIRHPDENQLIVTTCATGEFALIGIQEVGLHQIYLPVITR